MTTTKSFGIITILITFLIHISQSRNIQMDCLTLCAEGINPLKFNIDCDCYSNDPFRYVKRGGAKIPFRYGKRSSMTYPLGLQHYRTGYGVRSFNENPFLSRDIYEDY